ncbi:hypothetical protein GOV13_05090, partial [Candidatus Pacearchaeota archaeon]|nr:hypothetical protein [Candidatus Pacearchaeota archaeon]
AGNIMPALRDQDDRRIYIILADLFTYTSSRRDDITLKNALAMASESYALGLNSNNVLYIIQSEVSEILQPLFTIISCLLKYKRLVKTQPLKKMFNDEDINFGEISFPIIQCTEMVATRSEVLYSNIDNLGIISLTKYLFRQLSQYTDTDLPTPKLQYGQKEFLLGIDYKKMSHGSNNAVYLSDSPETIYEKIKKIRTDNCNGKDIDFSLIFDYLELLNYNKKQLNELVGLYNQSKLGALDIKKILIDELTNKFKPVQEKKKELLNNRGYLINRIRDDTLEAKKIIQLNVDEILSNFYEKDFFNSFKV